MLDEQAKQWLLALDSSRRAPTKISHGKAIYLVWAVMLSLIIYHWIVR